MNGAVDFFDLLERPLGPVWRDRMIIAENAETEAQAILAKKGK